MGSSASGQYQLSVLLKLSDQLSSGLSSKTLPTLRKFRTEIKSTLTDYGKLSRALGKPISTSSVDKLVGKYRAAVKEMRALSQEQTKLGSRLPGGTPGEPQPYRSRSGRRAAHGGFLAGVERADQFLQGTRQIANGWRDRADSLRPYIDETLRLVRAQEKFKAINLSPAENEKAFGVVRKQVEQMKGISLTDATETITDLHTALGSLDHAIEAMPIASKYRFAFSTIFGDKFSNEQIEEQLRGGMKFLELTGKVAKGRGEMERYFNVMAQMGAATGGRVNPSEMLLMAKRAGPSLQGLSVEGLRHLSAPIQELGGEGAGTALMSQYQALVGGVMKKSAKEEFQRLGLVDTSKIETGKHSDIIKKVLPGWNKLTPLMQEDPLRAADQLLGAFAAKGIIQRDTLNKIMKGEQYSDEQANKIREELTILFQKSTAQRLMSILTTQRNQVVKESGLSTNAKDIEGLYKQADEGPLGAIQRYEKGMENFRATMGQAILPLMSQFADYATPIASFFSQHETLTKWTAYGLLAGKALGGLVETASIFGRTGRGVYKTFDYMARGADDAASALSRAERNALGLGSSVKGMGALKFGAGLGLITIGAIAVEKIAAKYLELEEVRVQQKEAAKSALDITTKVAPAPKFTPPPSIKTGASWISRMFGIPPGVTIPSLTRGRDMSQAAIRERLRPQNVWRERAQIDWKNLNADHALEYATDRSTMPLSERMNWRRVLPGVAPMESWSGEFDVERVSRNLPRTLEHPGVLMEFRKLLAENQSRGVITPATKENTEQALSRRFPQLFEQSTQMLQKSFALQLSGFNPSSQFGQILLGFEPPAKAATDALSKIGPSADKLPVSFDHAGSAAERLSARFDGVQPAGPPAGDGFGTSTKRTTMFGVLGLPGMAKGGRVRRGKSVWTGERGIELFTPGEDGYITPHHDLVARAAGLRESLRAGALSAALSNSSATEVHNHIAIHVQGDVKDPKLLAESLADRITEKLAELDRKVNSRRHFDNLLSQSMRNERQRT